MVWPTLVKSRFLEDKISSENQIVIDSLIDSIILI